MSMKDDLLWSVACRVREKLHELINIYELDVEDEIKILRTITDDAVKRRNNDD